MHPRAEVSDSIIGAVKSTTFLEKKFVAFRM